MEATESYYQRKIQQLNEQLGQVELERDRFKEELDRWKTCAGDIGWKGEHPATYFRQLALSIADIPFYQEVIKNLSGSRGKELFGEPPKAKTKTYKKPKSKYDW
jgi:hypothetical protein